MSYILDALHKSEQQRKNQSTPDLTTVHRQDQAVVMRRSPWIAITLMLITLNLTGIGWWLMQTSTDLPLATTPSVSNLEPAVPASEPTLTKPPTKVVDEPSLTQRKISTSDPSTTLVESAVSDSQLEITPKPIGELPPDIQRQIPDLVFSSHLYSNDFRLVNINGRMMREGESIAPNLKLVEITESGVILEFRAYRISMSVLQDWAFD